MATDPSAAGTPEAMLPVHQRRHSQYNGRAPSPPEPSGSDSVIELSNFNGTTHTHGTSTVTATNAVAKASAVGSNVDESDYEIRALVGDQALPDGASPARHHGDGHGLAVGTASNAQVAVNIVISFVGAGLLGIPDAFRRAGWLLGTLTLATVSALNVYAMLLLPHVKRKLLHLRQKQQQNSTRSDETHTDTHELLLLDSYGALGRAIMGPNGETFVNGCLVVSQVGFATAYIIFIAANLHSLAGIPRGVTCLACVPGLCGLVQARDMKTLAPFSLLADAANVLGLSAVLFEDWETYYQPHDDVIHKVRWSGFLYVIAITVYSMEGVGLILSLETSSRQPQSFPSLFRTVLTCITLFMSLFGTAGYMGFGENTQAPITLNLTDSNVALLVKSALCLALYLTYPVMMFPVWNITETILLSTRDHTVTRVAFRSALVVLTAMVAWLVPDFGAFLSLVGSSICTVLGFILPCWFHWKVMGNELPNWQVGLDLFLMVGGGVFGVLGTYQSITSLGGGDE